MYSDGSLNTEIYFQEETLIEVTGEIFAEDEEFGTDHYIDPADLDFTVYEEDGEDSFYGLHNLPADLQAAVIEELERYYFFL